MSTATGNVSTPASSALYGRAQRVIPGGVNSPVRAMRQIGRDPIFVASGSGARVTDVDGNVYIDWVCSWGPLILGHANPRVLQAINRAAALGSSFGAPTEGEVLIAELVAERMPAVEMLRMTSSGTEASMSAIRLARAVTGREALLKFQGAYHGHVDGLLVQAGSGLATQGIPASPGVPAAVAQATIAIPWNDEDALAAALDAHQFAAVLVEAVPANMGVVPAKPGYLARLGAAARQNGVLFVVDEVITGFRVAPGGAQELYGLEPDLTILGKVIGGGLPAAAYGGRRELMSQIAPAGEVYQAGTLSGNPLAVAAGLATLEQLDQEAYRRLAELTERLAVGLREAAASAGLKLRVQSATGLLTPFFTGVEVTDYAGASACDQQSYAAFCRGLLARGVYPPASQFEAWFPSLAHSERDIELTVEAAGEVLAELAS
ncbi:glutamate-1-semialdehyde 2,1-aminomutase [Conexibacter sp. S30A1]|uniref:glutamate-1-semialdehyde 2,1-aminomutase n=1 Tax=Conexibacter sp. S30A1 TaxID=2937800 RepID=UPI00200BDBD5|nr:glutamate-1-semialdehyde 2,1-aminomutase [Conexibacter sp. S30A1]